MWQYNVMIREVETRGSLLWLEKWSHLLRSLQRCIEAWDLSREEGVWASPGDFPGWPCMIVSAMPLFLFFAPAHAAHELAADATKETRIGNRVIRTNKPTREPFVFARSFIPVPHIVANNIEHMRRNEAPQCFNSVPVGHHHHRGGRWTIFWRWHIWLW